MAKLCECCKKTSSFLADDEFDLGNNTILCHQCAAPIRNDMIDIHFAKTEEEFNQLKEQILATCQAHYPDNVTTAVAEKIQKTHDQKFRPQEDTPPSMATDTESGARSLYHNIGGKIKTLAKISALIGAIWCICAGIYYIGLGISKNWSEHGPFGLYCLIFGPILSWIGSFVLYGFGQLVENSDKMLAIAQKQENEKEQEK